MDKEAGESESRAFFLDEEKQLEWSRKFFYWIDPIIDRFMKPITIFVEGTTFGFSLLSLGIDEPETALISSSLGIAVGLVTIGARKLADSGLSDFDITPTRHLI